MMSKVLVLQRFRHIMAKGLTISQKCLRYKKVWHCVRSSLQLNEVSVECDSKIVVEAIRTKQILHWHLRYALRLCLQTFPTSYTICHIFRQANMVAYRHDFFYEEELQHTVRTTLIADCMGLWGFRQ